MASCAAWWVLGVVAGLVDLPVAVGIDVVVTVDRLAALASDAGSSQKPERRGAGSRTTVSSSTVRTGASTTGATGTVRAARSRDGASRPPSQPAKIAARKPRMAPNVSAFPMTSGPTPHVDAGSSPPMRTSPR